MAGCQSAPASQNAIGLAENHWDSFADEVRGLELADISGEADRVLRPANMVWVVVGDREQIEEGVRGLGLGDVRFLDADGNPVEGR